MVTDDILILYQHNNEESIKSNTFCLYLINKNKYSIDDFLEENKNCNLLYTWNEIPVLFSLHQLMSQLHGSLRGVGGFLDDDFEKQRFNHLTSIGKPKDEVINIVRRTINTTQFNPEND